MTLHVKSKGNTVKTCWVRIYQSRKINWLMFTQVFLAPKSKTRAKSKRSSGFKMLDYLIEKLLQIKSRVKK